MMEEQITVKNEQFLTKLEGKTIIRRWKIDMEELNEVNNVSNSELDKIVGELSKIDDDDLEYMGDEEIDDELGDEEIDDDMSADEIEDEIDDDLKDKPKNKEIKDYI
jgi:hypothetical protein